MKQHYRRPSLVMVCILGVALAGAALADDDMHKKDAMPGAMGQQPASTPAMIPATARTAAHFVHRFICRPHFLFHLFITLPH